MFSSQVLIASLTNMFQHAFSAVLVCVLCPSQHLWPARKGAPNWGEVAPTPLHSVPLLQHPSAPPVAVGEVGDWPRRHSAIPAAVLAALELPLGLTYCLVSLSIIAHCWFFFSFPFDSVALVPYSDSSSISQSGESEERENGSSADFFCILWKCPCAMCDSNLFFL